MIVLNVSRIKTLLTCPREYQLRYEQDLIPVREKTEARDFGTTFHAALRRHYSGDTGAETEFNTSLVCPDDMRGYGQALFRLYLDHWQTADGLEETEEVEKELRMEIPEGPLGPGGILVGRLDRIVRLSGALEGVWHQQHKTTGTNDMAGYVGHFNLDPHETAYTILARANGIPLRGTRLNLIRKAPIDERGRFKTSKAANPQPPFLRVTVPVTERKVQEFINQFQFAAALVASGERPQFWTGCIRFGGICAYQPTCLGMAQPIADDLNFKNRELDYVDSDPEQERMG